MRNVMHRPARLVGGLTLAAGLVLTGCGDDDSAGPEAGPVTTEDLQELENQIRGFDDRLTALEGGEADARSDIIGKKVTISAEVSEVISSKGVGSAFRIGDDSGASVAVLAGSMPAGLDANDTVRITGTVKRIVRDSFEKDFGIAEGALFDDPDVFFDEFDGQAAIAATSITVLKEQTD